MCCIEVVLDGLSLIPFPVRFNDCFEALPELQFATFFLERSLDGFYDYAYCSFT
jgi:hypothetical protein